MVRCFNVPNCLANTVSNLLILPPIKDVGKGEQFIRSTNYL